MKLIGAALDPALSARADAERSRLDALLGDMARAREAREAGPPVASGPSSAEPSPVAPEPSGMVSSQTGSRKSGGAAKRSRKASSGSPVQSLQAKRSERVRAKAASLEALAREAGLSDREASALGASLVARSGAPNNWRFVLLNTQQFDDVHEWIATSKAFRRPLIAVRLWSKLIRNSRGDTGEVLKDRHELAAMVGVTPNEVSEVLAALARANALRRERMGSNVRYFLNPLVMTSLGSAELRARAQEAGGPVLIPVEGGRHE